MKNISYVIIYGVFTIPFDSNDNQIGLLDALTLDECCEMSSKGIKIYFA